MSTKKYYVVVQDDWELEGNGSGNVASHQYMPSLFLSKLSKEYGVKPTFMIECAQQLEFLKNKSKSRNIKLQSVIWEETVKMLYEEGHDVQLHIHPQWINAKLNGDFFTLGNDWNLARYSDVVISEIITKSKLYLESIINPIDNSYKVTSFKAGGWGLQPSENLLTELRKNGINLILGPRKNLVNINQNIDYSEMEECNLPYFPDIKNINKISNYKSEIRILPLSYTSYGFSTAFYLYWFYKMNKVFPIEKGTLFQNWMIPKSILVNNKFDYRNKIKSFKTKNFKIYSHLKIGGNLPLFFLKKSFDQVISRLNSIEENNIPIVIESHTKNFKNQSFRILKFFDYITTKYNKELVFVSLSELNQLIKDGVIKSISHD